MYQIKCDGFVLYDPRDDDLILSNPKCRLEVNTVGEASFSIYANHPHYGQLQKMRSIVEILQDGNVIFRGRMTDDTRDFNNIKAVDLEGVMAFFNDSVIRPFSFPEDFAEDADYIASDNKVAFLLGWLIDQHNAQVQPFQQFKLGDVTVADPNNYVTRSTEEHLRTWEVFKSRLFDSALGGYLCIRYEADGNYIDYLEDFVFANNQKITFGENLLDLISESDASETYSAILPLGKKRNEIDPESTDTSRLTIAELGDGDLTDDIVKSGDILYSRSAVEMYGFICAPPAESTWEDVTEAANLQTKGMDWLINQGMKLASTITIKAVDLHFSDEDIEAFRIYRYINVESKPHNHEGQYKLTKLEIDILNPQNTVITLGDTQLTMTDINAGIKSSESGERAALEIRIHKSLEGYEEVLLHSASELFNTKIAQYSQSIELSVNGSLGSNASIKLTAGGVEKKQTLDLSKVREAFANDNTAVTISGGKVTFNAGTLVINSTNFAVTAEGDITATSGTVGAITLTSTGIHSHNAAYAASFAGWYRPLTIASTTTCFFAGATDAAGTSAKFLVTYGGSLKATDAEISGIVTTVDDPYKAQLTSGGLRVYYDDILCGTLNTKYWSGAATAGISLRIEEGGNYIMFSHPSENQSSGYTVDYYLNYGWSSNYKEMHIFQTSARFLDKVYFPNSAYFNSPYIYNNYYLKSAESDGTAGVEMIGYASARVNVGSTACPTMLRGTTVYLKNTNTTVTSDRNAKKDIEALPDAYEVFIDALEPVRFRYKEGTSGRFHTGYIAQDVEQALLTAGLDTADFAGYVDIGGTGELGLSYDQFIAILHRKIKRLEARLAALG